MALDREASQSGVVLGRSSTGPGAYEDVPFAALSPNDGTAANCLIQSYPRVLVSTGTLAALVSGTLRLDSIRIPAGMLISSIAYYAGTTAIDTATNQWFALFDKNKALLAITADNADAAWAANAVKRLNLATAYRTTYSGLYYVGCCVVASTPPTLSGIASVATGPRNIGFIQGGASDTSLTDPASAPTTATTITCDGRSPYIELY
jgi:hypothetical protein